MTPWWMNYEVDDETGCWLWLGKITTKGYAYRVRQIKEWRENGKRKRRRSVVKVHRLMFERVHGPLGVGQDVHHKCKTKRCINPRHLEALGSVAHRRLHGLQKLTIESVMALRHDSAIGFSSSKLALKYGICPQNARKIVSGKTWKAAHAGQS